MDTKTVRNLIELRPTLRGTRFKDLSVPEKEILYASHLEDDPGADLNIVAQVISGANPKFIDAQLRVAYQYKDDTIIL